MASGGEVRNIRPLSANLAHTDKWLDLVIWDRFLHKLWGGPMEYCEEPRCPRCLNQGVFKITGPLAVAWPHESSPKHPIICSTGAAEVSHASRDTSRIRTEIVEHSSGRIYTQNKMNKWICINGPNTHNVWHHLLCSIGISCFLKIDFPASATSKASILLTLQSQCDKSLGDWDPTWAC